MQIETAGDHYYSGRPRLPSTMHGVNIECDLGGGKQMCACLCACVCPGQCLCLCSIVSAAYEEHRMHAVEGLLQQFSIMQSTHVGLHLMIWSKFEI